MRLLRVLISLDRRSCCLDTGDLDELRAFMIVHYVLSLPETTETLTAEIEEFAETNKSIGSAAPVISAVNQV
jgi:hypothetical protein